jgi:hypothetical protein
MVSGMPSVCFAATIKRVRISLGVRNYAANDERSEQAEASVITTATIADWDHRDCLIR